MEKPLQTYPYFLTITTYNRLPFLRHCLESFFRSTNQEEWGIIIADDGSTDGTLSYIKELSSSQHIHLIENNRAGVHNQKNHILKHLSDKDFQVAFMIDDDVVFKQHGWDALYRAQIEQTAYKHLIYYDTEWNPANNLETPIRRGNLICHTLPTSLQGAFFTLTPEVIKEVGYFDVQHFGFKGLGHLDYSLRCCRAGFNDISSSFDVAHSHAYLELQKENYTRSVPLSLDRKINKQEVVAQKVKLMQKPERKYVAFHTVEFNFDDSSEYILIKGQQWRLADPIFYREGGVVGLLGTILKRLYNFSLRHGFTFFPIWIKKAGKKMQGKWGRHLEMIDQ